MNGKTYPSNQSVDWFRIHVKNLYDRWQKSDFNSQDDLFVEVFDEISDFLGNYEGSMGN